VSDCRCRLFVTVPRSSRRRPSVNRSTEGSECPDGAGGGRDAPLFLGNIVSRRFKYRWLILALFGFSGMAVIVALSVVYSNKWRHSRLRSLMSFETALRTSTRSKMTVLSSFGVKLLSVFRQSFPPTLFNFPSRSWQTIEREFLMSQITRLPTALTNALIGLPAAPACWFAYLTPVSGVHNSHLLALCVILETRYLNVPRTFCPYWIKNDVDQL